MARGAAVVSLWEKLGATTPGKHARALGEVVYNRGHEMSKADMDRMSSAQAYLESLALAEVEATVDPWVAELIAAKLKDAGEPKP